jgi:hypothetical protein
VREICQRAKYINPHNRGNDGAQEDVGIPAEFWQDGEEDEQEDRGNHERGIGNPIVEYSIQDMSKRTRALKMKGVHNRLAIIIYGYKKNPGKAKSKNESV